jgi:hypothetical protein
MSCEHSSLVLVERKAEGPIILLPRSLAAHGELHLITLEQQLMIIVSLCVCCGKVMGNFGADG